MNREHNRLRVYSRLALRIAGLPVIVMMAGCSEPPVAEVPIRPVKAMVMQPPSTERALVYSGVLAPRIDSTLGFRVAGKIVERSVNVGDAIERGQTIARLDEADLKLSENSARATVAGAKTRLAVAQDALNRANFLLPKEFIAKSAVDQRQLEVDSARAQFDAAQDQLKQAINASSYAVLTADKAGIVTSVRAEPGQVVGAGQAVVTLALAGDIEAAVAVPEQEIAMLKVGDKANVSLWAADAVRGSGKIREIAGSADAASRTYAVRIALDTPAQAMRLGMTAAVTFQVPMDKREMIVPLSALVGEQVGKETVFVADRDTETVKMRSVGVAGVTDTGVRIVSGLSAGDIVVTGGVQFLRDGMKVRLPKEVLPAIAGATRS